MFKAKLREAIECIYDEELSHDEVVEKYSREAGAIIREARLSLVIDFLLKVFNWDYQFISKELMKNVLAGNTKDIPDDISKEKLMQTLVPAIFFVLKGSVEDMQLVVGWMKGMCIDDESDLPFM